MSLDLIGDSFAKTYNFNEKITITDIKELPGNYEINIETNDYEEIVYYFQHTGYSSINLSLFAQESSSTIPIKFIVLDKFGDPIDEKCLFELEIYKISTNSYESYIMEYINSIGEVIFNLDISKRFKSKITCNGETQVYEGEKITSTPVYKKFIKSNLENYISNPNIKSLIEYNQLNNNTGRFKFTYNDLDNIISEACLRVFNSNYLEENMISEQCISTSAGSINIDFNTIEGSTYKAFGYVTYYNEEEKINSRIEKIIPINFNLDKFGILLSLIIIGVMSIGGALIGKAKGSLIGATLSLWIVSPIIFGLWNIPITSALISWSILLIVGLMLS